MLEKFDGTRSKFWRFLQQIKFYVRLHPFQYFYGFTQVGFIYTLLSKSVLFKFVLLIEKNFWLFYDLNIFLEVFMTIFGESDQEIIAKTKLLSL